MTHYQLGTDSEGFYAEFLTPLRGGTHKRDGSPDETEKIQGVNAQKLRHLELLLIEPWNAEISTRTGFPLTDAALVLVPNPVSFIVQKLLVYFDRKPEKRPGDLLYIHDTIVVFSPVLDDLAALWRSSVAPALSSKGYRELTDNVSATVGAVTDTLRNAARMVPTRRMDPEIMRRVCSEGLKRLLP
ncbi:MAG: GSU2403 family nucleotidyltransferase fold protein [Acidobacteria bacterium]|nr:GSU2403 family nucleotidyltransferase fold protein [Acidobacteriota bacterium]